jgi:hypothetical protein
MKTKRQELVKPKKERRKREREETRWEKSKSKIFRGKPNYKLCY